MTNFERWKKTLTAEEFVLWALTNSCECHTCPARDWCSMEHCEDEFLAWANAEAKEDENGDQL